MILRVTSVSKMFLFKYHVYLENTVSLQEVLWNYSDVYLTKTRIWSSGDRLSSDYTSKPFLIRAF